MNSGIHSIPISPVGLIALLLLLAFSANSQTPEPLTDEWPVKNNALVQGFEKVDSGATFDFFPFLRKGKVVLYLGENEKYPQIALSTANPTPSQKSDFVSFIFGVGLAQSLPEEEPSQFRVFIDDKSFMTFSSATETGPKSWQYTNPEGIQLAFVHTAVTEPHGDLFGYMILNVPTKSLTPDAPMQLRFEEIRSNKRDYFMVIQNPVKESLLIFTEPAILKTEIGPKQRIQIDLTYLGPPTTCQIQVGGQAPKSHKVKPGQNKLFAYVEPVTVKTEMNLRIQIAKREPTNQKVKLLPVRQFEVYFLPHSHVDIGFTHKQEEVARLQWANLDMAIDLAESTADYPERSQYKWNAEISWVLDGYLKQASAERKEKFLNAVRKGRIGVDALYGSTLTGLQREEELYYNTYFANKISKEYNLDVQSAMISDVPGYTWGMVPSMAQTGIRYFSVGPNHMPQLAHGGYQVGRTFEAWGDVPMYWTSPSGEDKVLFWMSSHGYSWFHSWLTGNIKNAGGEPILKFLKELDDQKYPYDMVQLRYNIGNDNGPPDPDMPDFFREWNKEYAWPKFRIATTLEMMKDFESRYAGQIPEASGDFTPYWEDGAASSAKETALNRNAADQLIQAEVLWSLNDRENFPRERFEEAWTNVLLFSEHTWGANISKSDPDSEFTKSLWEVKKSFVTDASNSATTLAGEILPASNPSSISEFQVVNTQSWERSELVKIPAEWQTVGDRLLDDQGKKVLTQRLASGELAFYAADIPPFAARTYSIKKGKAQPSGSVRVTQKSIENDQITIRIDPDMGSIISIIGKKANREFIDQNDTTGFNTYWYSGKVKENLSRSHSPEIRVVESGPLLSSLQVAMKGAGVKTYSYTVEVNAFEDKIKLTNTVDKIKVIEDENVRFSYPFAIPNGQVRLDIPWAVLEPGKNQLKGANNNFYSVQRFVDISNEDYGITMTTQDDPIWEIGDMYGQQWMSDMELRPWLPDYIPSQRLYSWVMNNIWFVNYKAFQEGPITFRHTIQPHGIFSASTAKKFGMEETMPLLLTPTFTMTSQSPLRIEGSENVIVTSMKPGAEGDCLMLRMFNSSNEQATIRLIWEEQPKSVLYSSPLEEKGAPISTTIDFKPWGIQTFRVEK